MKKIKKVIFVIIILLSLIGGYFYIDGYNFFEKGDVETFGIKVGESFTIKLYANGSSGYHNCWINENKCQFVELLGEEYESSWQEKLGYIGAGGTVMLTFIGNSNGTDTIKISDCPTGWMHKDCSFFAEGSTHLNASDSPLDLYIPNKSADYNFIVNVTE